MKYVLVAVGSLFFLSSCSGSLETAPKPSNEISEIYSDSIKKYENVVKVPITDSTLTTVATAFTTSSTTTTIAAGTEVSHKVTSSDTLSSIADKYRTSLCDLAVLNNLYNVDSIFDDTELLIVVGKKTVECFFPTTTTTSSTTMPVVETTMITIPVEITAPFPLTDSSYIAGSGIVTDVLSSQIRLNELGFWVGVADGQFGSLTKQGVIAFQKYHNLSVTGELTDETLSFLSTASYPVSKYASGTLIEIDKLRQLLFLVVDGKVSKVLSTSTASGETYVNKYDKETTAVTPVGDFSVWHTHTDGWQEGYLGALYRPIYFNGSIAVHGSGSIPSYPASHGCARVSTSAMDLLWAQGWAEKGVRVAVY